MLCTSVDLNEEAHKIQSLREQLAYVTSLQKRRGVYLLQQGEEIIDNLDGVRMVLQDGARVDHHGGAEVLLDRIHDTVQMVSEIIRLELGDAPMAPFPADLNELTRQSLTAMPGDMIPAWTLTAEPSRPHGWIDPVRYAYLLKTLLLHMKHVGCTAVTIQLASFEPDAGRLEWMLRVKGGIALHTRRIAPVIYLGLVNELCGPLHGSLRVLRDDEQAFEASVAMVTPIAAH
jgi:two-component system sensor histidine kinase EvgS